MDLLCKYPLVLCVLRNENYFFTIYFRVDYKTEGNVFMTS